MIDCWEPMVFVAKSKGIDAVYADPKEGYLLWAMAAYIVKNPNRSAEQTKAAYQLLDFMLGGWYGAKITGLRGYMTNTDAPDYAKEHAGRVPRRRGREGRRHHRQRAPEVRARAAPGRTAGRPRSKFTSPSGRGSSRPDHGSCDGWGRE